MRKKENICEEEEEDFNIPILPYSSANNQNRNLYLFGEVNSENVSYLIDMINTFNEQDDIAEEAYEKNIIGLLKNPEDIIEAKKLIKNFEEKPIKLYINSPGGYVDETIALINTIKSSITPIIAINLASCNSGAFFIFISCRQRLAYTSSSFMYHNIRGGHNGADITYVERMLTQNKEIQKILDDMVINNTLLTADYLSEINQNRNDKYWNGLQAKELNIVDVLLDIKQEEI